MKKILFGLMAVACLTGSAMAANSASGTSTAYILTPLTLTAVNGGNLDFGRIATNDTACTVTIAESDTGAHTRSTAGGSCWLDPADDGNDADWNVTGEGNYGYTIELVSNSDMTGPACAGNNIIPIDQWKLDSPPVPNVMFNGANGDSGTVTGMSLVGGQDGFVIGGRASLTADQCPGAYSGTYTLKATYP